MKACALTWKVWCAAKLSVNDGLMTSSSTKQWICARINTSVKSCWTNLPECSTILPAGRSADAQRYQTSSQQAFDRNNNSPVDGSDQRGGQRIFSSLRLRHKEIVWRRMAPAAHTYNCTCKLFRRAARNTGLVAKYVGEVFELAQDFERRNKSLTTIEQRKSQGGINVSTSVPHCYGRQQITVDHRYIQGNNSHLWLVRQHFRLRLREVRSLCSCTTPSPAMAASGRRGAARQGLSLHRSLMPAWKEVCSSVRACGRIH